MAKNPSDPNMFNDPEFQKMLDNKVGATVAKRLKSQTNVISQIEAPPTLQKTTDQGNAISAAQNSNLSYHHIPNVGQRPGIQVQYINSVINSINSGVFTQVALFIDAIMEDEVIWGNLFVRLQSLVSSRIDIIAANDSEEALKARDLCEKHFPYMITSAQISELSRWGLLNGVGFANVFMSECDGYQIPKIKMWHPRFARFDWGSREYKMVTENMGEIFVLHEDPSWIIVEPYGDFYAWMRGMAKPIANIYLKRHWAFDWWARFQEFMGAPMLGAIVPPNTDPEDEEEFMEAIANKTFASSVRLPQGEDGNRYKLEVIQAESDLFAGFEAMLKYCDSKIAVLLLGQDFSTGGSPGFFSSENPGKALRQEIRRFDARCIEHIIHEKLIRVWALANFGDASLAPTIRFDIEDKEDQLKKTQSIQSLMDAFNKAGITQVPLDVKAILNDFDLPIDDTLSPKTSLQTDTTAPIPQDKNEAQPKVQAKPPEEKAQELSRLIKELKEMVNLFNDDNKI